ESTFDGQAKFEVSYFTSGLTWRMDYVSICNPDETVMHLRGYVRVFNNSGEEYENAEVRLIVGKINLVEKIAELARRYAQPMPRPGTARYRALEAKAAQMAFDTAEDAVIKAPKGVVKEGISEYFMFTIQGRETIPNRWSKRMRAVDAEDVKFDIVHRVRAHQYGVRPIRFFTFANDKEHKLGESPMPDGMFRIFRDNGREGLAFLAEQSIKYVPIKAKAEINVGADKLVVYERRKR
ncbi:unnamed protein product, partial [marine sediment metagenome]